MQLLVAHWGTAPCSFFPCRADQVWAWSCVRREMQDVQRRHSEQLDALNARCAELETANRKLRDIKYELDTKVCAPIDDGRTAMGWAIP